VHSIEELKNRARQGDQDALRELRERGFFAKKGQRVSYPVSDAQRRLWVLDQMAPASASYNVPGALRITGALDEDAFARALAALVARHESLRTRFDLVDGELRQIIEPGAEVALDRLSVRHAVDPVGAAHALVAERAARPFRLADAPLVTAALIELGSDDRVFAVTIHHIVCDAWSMQVLVGELFALYDAFARGAVNPLPPLRLQYKDVTAWQQQRIEAGEFEGARRYWLDQFAEAVPQVDLPRDFPRPAVQTFSGGQTSREIPRETVARLERTGATAGATMFMTLLAAARVLLLRYTGQRDVIVGTPVSGRTHPDLEQQVGFYVNLLPLRTPIAPADTFRQVLDQVRKACTAAYEHDYPFDRLVGDLDLPRDLSRSPLFDVLLSVEESQPAVAAPSGVQLAPFAVDAVVAKYDLTLFFTRSGDALHLAVNYNRDLFRAERMEVLAGHLVHSLDQLTARPDACVGDLPLADAREAARVREEFGTAPAPYPREQSIAAVFDAQASATPDADAVIAEDAAGETVRVSYRALRERADRVARQLRAQGVGLETPIGVLLERSERVAVALLGILKAGGCYVPLDPAAPRSRAEFVVADAGCRIVLCEADTRVRLGVGDDRMLGGASCLDVLDLSALENTRAAGDAPLASSTGAHLAYVMYTSGSTGEPKGTLIDQRAVLRLVRGSNFLQLGSGDRVLQTGSLAFDASTLEIWGPLLNGGAVCFAPGEDVVVAGTVAGLIARHDITTMWVTASLLNQWVESGEDVFGRLRCLLTGGEQLSPWHIGRLRDRYPDLRLVNGYGPTENTTFTTCHQIDAVDAGEIPIGRPVANTDVVILDDRLNPCAIGIAGEICTGGDGLARGYLHRADLTAERFVPHPFVSGARLYRTGDVGRWRWDGAVEFIGRRDTQVKVRGYRIETGEIEAALLRHPLIAEACVIAMPTDAGTRELVAYITGDSAVTTAVAREHLTALLPAYMVPSAFVRLDRLPLTRNGKVDRSALPDPDAAGEQRDGYEAPRTPVERALCVIWSEVLQVRDVGVRDNFFELGGHSLKATRVLTRIHRELTDQITLRDLFACPDVASLGARIGVAAPGLRAAIPRVPDAGTYPASHAQRRLWLLQRLSDGDGAYNVPGAIAIDGPIDAARLSQAFTRLVARHESLRTAFEEVDGELRQRVLPASPVRIPVVDVSSSVDPEADARQRVAADASAPFALDTAPLFRATLIRLAPERHVFLFTLHHIVTDAWSMRVLLGELLVLYRAVEAGSRDPLAPLAVQYRDYAVWQHAELASEAGQAHRQYWLDRFRDDVPALDLPTDAERPAVQSFRGNVVRSRIDAATVAQLRRLGQREGATLYVVLLALVRVLLFRHARQEEFVLGTGVSGREHADLDAQVGFFVNMLPLRQRITAGMAVLDVLRGTRDTVAEALEHQAYPFDSLVGDLRLKRDAGRQPLFDVVVTLDEDDGARRAGAADGQGPRVVPFEFPSPFSKFDLMFAFGRNGDGPCTVALEYSTDLFHADRIERLAAQFQQLVSSTLRDATATVGSIDLLPEHERRQLAAFSCAPAPYPSQRTMAAQFEEQAARTPEAVAVLAGDRALTFHELNARANVVAHALRARGVGLETPVGVLLERGERMAVALVGIMKAGGCYLPLDLAAPTERTAYMVADASCRIVLDEATLADCEANAGPGWSTNPAPLPGATATSLAYVMYTSGSTGQPKGTLIEQRSVLRLVLGTNFLQLVPGDRVLQTGSLAFDASTFELWGPLLTGSAVCFARTDDLLDAGRVRAAIARHGVTVMFVTTALFNQLVDGDEDVFTGLRCLMTGGEKVSVAHMNTVSRRAPSLSLLHVYGPTENTTFTTFYPVEGPHAIDVPIGGPLANTTVYVLDERGALAPIGVPGEICTGGDGLARGYLNRPDLTAERFVPFAPDPGNRVYRTGDVGRWRADGAVEFVGRVDNQVKIHGYRVEPGEIEARLFQHPAITQAVVLARTTTVGTLELVAYYAGDEGAGVAEVRAFLADALPAYMVPSAFFRLPALPINRNGKIDRAQLAALELEPKPDDEAPFDAPETHEEQVLAAVWAAVLDRPRVGRGDHYFDSGGDSIRAIQIVNRLRKAGWTFDVRNVFQYPMLKDAALCLVRAGDAAARAESTEPVPLTPIQRWFFTRAGDLHHFNHAVVLRSDVALEDGPLRAAVAAVLRHHRALRLAVSFDASGRPVAMTDVSADALARDVCEIRDFRDRDRDAWLADMQAVQRGFNLATGPLFKAVLYRRTDGDRLLLVAHHLIIDGVSWRIVLEDVDEAYRAFAARGAGASGGATPALTPRTHAFAEWAGALRTRAAEHDWSDDHAYWSSLCAPAEAERGAVPGVVPFDVPGASEATQSYGTCAAVETTFSAEATRALLEEVPAAFGTGVDDALLTALARALKRQHGIDRAWIAMEGHGRDTVPGIDVGGTVGWFTSLYPFLLTLDGRDGRQQLRHVKEALRAARRHAPGYTALRWLDAAPPLTAPAPDCRISLNYMGQVDDGAAAHGIFSLADDDSGLAIAPNLQREQDLEIGGVVRGGSLTLSITFGRERHGEAGMARLLEAMADELRGLIDECRTVTRGERTPSDFTGCPLSLPQYDALLAAQGWVPTDVEDVFPLTPMQEGLLFQSLLDAGSRAYFLQLNYRIAGPLDVDRFRRAWYEVARRHAVLRTAIVHEDLDRPLQVVLTDRWPEIAYDDLSALTAEARDERIREWRDRDMARGVDLQREPLMRMAVLRESTDAHHVVWSYHHVLLDGWSLGVLYRDFEALYQASGRGVAPRLEPPQPFARYMRWLLARDADAGRRFWADYLAGYTPVPLIEQLAAAPGTDAHESSEHVLTLDRETTARLTQAAAAAGVTLNTFVQAVWGVIVCRYTGARDVAFGAVVSGRPSALPGVEDMVGLFINTVPVRVRLNEDEPLLALLQRMQQEALEAEAFHGSPLAETQAAYPGGEVFDHLLVFENYPLGAGGDGEPDPDAIRTEAFEAHDRTHYDLDLTVVPGEALLVRFSYRPDRCDGAAVARLAGHFATVVAAAATDASRAISTLRLLTADDEAALVALGRGPRLPYPVDRTLSELFEAQAAAAPKSVAIRHAGQALTYAALNARANQIAHWLRQAGVGRGDFVGLLERRGVDLLAAMLGVLKAGGAFLPIDPEYPADRIRYMLADSAVRVVIGRAATVHGLLDDGVRLLDLDGEDLATCPVESLAALSGPRDTAYLLYTSGSTGRPKGAMVRHDGAVNHICAEFELLRFHSGTAFLQSAPSSSDISVWQFLAPGLIGGRTVVADYEDVADPARLFRLVRDEGVTLFELVPVVLKGLLDYAATLPAEDRALSALEYAMVTGETVPVALVNQWVAAYPHVPIVNAYGPTEAADDICQAEITAPLPADATTVPIGRPLANLRLYVLDDRQRLVPPAVAGEICVSGIGVGAGYWGDPEKTAAAFVVNPYADGNVDTVIYRTGDRGRWQSDGTLECLGRVDQQVKVRGFRIELEEVEHQLLRHPGVRHAAAGVRQVAGDTVLVAWFVGDVSATALREDAATRLPKAMVPSFLVPVDAMPLTPAGKIDRQALPAPDAAALAREHVEPATPVEAQVAAIWRDVLQVPRVGRHDSFFDLGGHSLKAMQVVSRIHRDLGARVSLQAFFEHATLAGLAALIAQGTRSTFEAIEPAPAQPDYELSHAQKRLWLLHHLDGRVAYNMPEAVVLDEPADRDALRRAFATLVERHEMLRTAFVLVDGEPRQRILDEVAVEIREIDLMDSGSEEAASARAATLAAAEAAVPFDLTAPPLLRAVLYHLTPERDVFLMVIHHVIGDGWSMNVLYREVLALYDAYRHGRPDPLRPLRIQYKDFARWQNRQDLAEDERYWLDALSGAPDRLALPYDALVEGDRDFSGSTEPARLDAATVARLQAVAAAHGTTLSNVVLAIFQLVLYQWTRQADFSVGLAIASRNRPELESLIGFFVNILPIRVLLSRDMDFAELLALVKARTTAAFEHQDYPFDLLVQRLNPEREGNRQPVLNVIYAFQNFEDVTIDIGMKSAPEGATGAPQPDTGTAGVPPAALVRPFAVPFETSKFDMTLFVSGGDDGGLLLSLEYDTQLFRRETIRRALGTMTRFAGMVG
jgi:amino acid adenylation domain-containing protein/non-ribosomal peptide synthase protein (TIGR01720 family)